MDARTHLDERRHTPAHTNAPFGWVTDTGNKFERGRLARAVWPNDGERFSFFDLEGDAIQGQGPPGIGVGQLLDLDGVFNHHPSSLILSDEGPR